LEAVAADGVGAADGFIDLISPVFLNFTPRPPNPPLPCVKKSVLSGNNPQPGVARVGCIRMRTVARAALLLIGARRS